MVTGAGATVIVMASRALARVARTRRRLPVRLLDACCREVSEPVILHWLGPMFDPALAGYWGSARRRRGHPTFTDLVTRPRRPRSTA